MSQLRWALIATAILAGLFMSEFYEWSGEDQSRAAPIVRWIGLGILIFDLCAFGWLAWRHRGAPAPNAENRWKRFSIRHVLVGTTGVALIIAAQLYTKTPLIPGVLAAALGYAVWVAIRRPELRGQVVTLLVCLWAPLLWIVRWPETGSNVIQMLIILPGMPGLIPAGLVGFLTGQNMVGRSTLPAFCTTIELLIGLWTIYLGPRRALAYTLSVLTISLFSSFVLQALVRM